MQRPFRGKRPFRAFGSSQSNDHEAGARRSDHKPREDRRADRFSEHDHRLDRPKPDRESGSERARPRPGTSPSPFGGKGEPQPHRPSGGKPHEKKHAPRAGEQKPHATSWEKSADWYDRIIGERGSELYRSVVIPAALDLLRPAKGERILDIGCGQGVFSRALAEAGADVTGVDASRSLITTAKSYPAASPIRYLERDAGQVGDLGPVDGISAILCIQNMQHLPAVCAACSRALRPGGRMVWVLNHPCFRIPRQSSWGFDGERVQFRRLDGYAVPASVSIVMHPGKKDSESTISFHRSLADLTSAAFAAGFVISGIQELISNKESEPGPRAKAENRARKEFPLFLVLRFEKPATINPLSPA